MFDAAFILYGYVKQCKIEMATAIQIVWQNGRHTAVAISAIYVSVLGHYQKCDKSVNKTVYGKLVPWICKIFKLHNWSNIDISVWLFYR